FRQRALALDLEETPQQTDTKPVRRGSGRCFFLGLSHRRRILLPGGPVPHFCQHLAGSCRTARERPSVSAVAAESPLPDGRYRDRPALVRRVGLSVLLTERSETKPVWLSGAPADRRGRIAQETRSRSPGAQRQRYCPHVR